MKTYNADLEFKSELEEQRALVSATVCMRGGVVWVWDDSLVSVCVEGLCVSIGRVLGEARC